MNHTVSNTKDPCATVLRPKPGSQHIEGRAAIRHPIIQIVLYEDSAVSVLGGESRRRPDALNLTSGLQSPFLRVWPPVYAELQARRARVKYECVIIHTDPLCLLPSRMCHLHSHSATGNAGANAIRPAGEDDRYPRPQH